MFEETMESLVSAYRLLRRTKNRTLNLADPPVILLAYHRVTRLGSDPHQLAITPDNFCAQMHYLRKNFHCLRFDEDWSDLQGPAVVVTFDDGYADNFYQALPIIAEAGVPATFFISTGTLGTRAEFWSDELEYLILGEGNRPGRFALQDDEYRRDWSATSREERLALHWALHSLMLKISAHRREDWLDQLRRWASLDRAGRDAYRSLTWDELQELAASPWVTIGAHGVTHTPLAVLEELEQSQEISRSKQLLEEVLNLKVDLFSYPFGGHRQYDATTRRLCRAAGCRYAVTTLPGQVHRWTDPLQLPRQMVRDWDVQTFAARLENFRV